MNNSISTFNVKSWIKKCYEAMNDDFNSPVLISYLFRAVQLIQDIRSGKEQLSLSDLNILKETMFTFSFDILGISIYPTFKYQLYFNIIKYLVQIIIQIRIKARYDQLWEYSDNIRLELLKVGVLLNDVPHDI